MNTTTNMGGNVAAQVAAIVSIQDGINNQNGAERAVAPDSSSASYFANALVRLIGVEEYLTGSQVMSILYAGLGLYGLNFGERFINYFKLWGTSVVSNSADTTNGGEDGSSEGEFVNVAEVANIDAGPSTGWLYEYIKDSFWSIVGDREELITQAIIDRITSDAKSRSGVFGGMSIAGVGDEAIIFSECVAIAIVRVFRDGENVLYKIIPLCR
jgi:hypothetical protein